MNNSSTVVNCEQEGHCPHEGTAVGSYYCCRCGQYLYSLAERLSFYEDHPFFKAQRYLIEAHPEWGVKYL